MRRSTKAFCYILVMFILFSGIFAGIVSLQKENPLLDKTYLNTFDCTYLQNVSTSNNVASDSDSVQRGSLSDSFSNAQCISVFAGEIISGSMCTTEMLGIRSYNSVESISCPVRRSSVRLLLATLYILIFSYIIFKLQYAVYNNALCRHCYKNVIINYIHNKDGEK